MGRRLTLTASTSAPREAGEEETSKQACVPPEERRKWICSPPYRRVKELEHVQELKREKERQRIHRVLSGA